MTVLNAYCRGAGKHFTRFATLPARARPPRGAHTDTSTILQEYGYAAIFVGTCAEGESMLLLGGYAAHRGYLSLAGVMLVAFVAAILSDQVYFHLGRRYGARFLAKRPALALKVTRALGLVERRSALVVLAMRFLWGLRIAMPFAVGMSTLPAPRYLLLNVLASAIWAVSVGSLGFFGSRWLAKVVDDFHRHEVTIVVVLVISGLCMLLWRWLPRRQAPP